MQKINFTKMVASGNDFVVIKVPQCPSAPVPQKLARSICDRKYGIGADGLLVLEKSKIADTRMRIFNADGSEAQMCGNGARCVALYQSHPLDFARDKQVTPSTSLGASKSPPRLRSGQASRQFKIETKAGIIESQVDGKAVRIKLTDPYGLKLGIPIKINNKTLHVNFINTGVPHAVIFVEGLDKIDVFNLGRQIRYHPKFKPAGANVYFIEVFKNNFLKIRTYERGVEDETLACGTGAVASVLITSSQFPVPSSQYFSVQTRSQEVLKVCFEKKNNKFSNVWLEGKARIVYRGEYYV